MKIALFSAVAVAGALAFAGAASADSVTIATPPVQDHVTVHEHVITPPPVEHDRVIVHGRSATDCATKKTTVEHMNGDTTTHVRTNCD
jgi:hypothetical protein